MTDSTGPNPLLQRSGLPAFDRVKAHHVEPAVESVLARSNEVLERIEADLDDPTQTTWDNTIGTLEALGRDWEQAWSPVTHLMGVKNSDELREAHDSVLPKIVAMGLKLRQSLTVYRALKWLRNSDQWADCTEVQQRIIDDRLRDAELAGIALEPDDQDRFNEIAAELSQLATTFSNHVLDATKAWELVIHDPDDVEGMPETLLQLAAQSHNDAAPDDDSRLDATAEAGPWRFTLDVPIAMPFLQHCRNRDLREQLYRAYGTRASAGEWDNSPLINDILALRRERAQLLGYESFAEVSLATKMAPDIASVETLLETLRAASWEAGVRDLEELRDIAISSGQDEPLAQWDLAFWAERLRESRFDFTDEDLRPYFSLERVLDGMFELATTLFDITVVPADGQVATWHDDVRYFVVRDSDGEPVAGFFLDPYSRPETKRGGAWMNECLARCVVDGEIQLPVAHLVCNSTPPVGDRPSLMTFREVETLFHEFGHGLQHMLTTVDHADASGINGVEWDAVELPSQFMENWCYHEPTLMNMARHHETGASLPSDLFDKLLRARTFRAGSLMLRQLNFGKVDMFLHHQFDVDGDETVFDVQRRIAEQTSPMPPLAEDRFLCGFQHIFAGGYAAGYFSYKWAEVLSADAFSAFEEAGLDDPAAITKTGRRFRDTVLASGGGRHPMDVFKDFRGREPNPDALLRHNGLTSGTSQASSQAGP